MVNATCQMICFVDQLISYHNQSPGYVGNYTIPSYNAIALAGAATAGTIYVAQQLFRGATNMCAKQWARDCGTLTYKSYLPKAVSVLKWSALTIGVGARVVALLDNIAFLIPMAPPSDYFPVWTITWGFNQICPSRCGG